MEKLIDKVDNLQYFVGLVYKIMKSKELRISIDKVEVLICPKEAIE